ncbi:MAG: hypothetical protein JSW12_06025 [Deltaproteobacteria bacterium]|nr:MAG: hypothetical protein JSW12_06025 [Deltaproteobacteria bacterium]
MAKKKEGKTSSATQARSKPKKKEVVRKEKRPSPINLWGVAGRQEIMEMRRLWQLRIPGR